MAAVIIPIAPHRTHGGAPESHCEGLQAEPFGVMMTVLVPIPRLLRGTLEVSSNGRETLTITNP